MLSVRKNYKAGLFDVEAAVLRPTVLIVKRGTKEQSKVCTDGWTLWSSCSYCCCYFRAAEGIYTGEGGIADVVIILFVVVINSVLMRSSAFARGECSQSKVIRDLDLLPQPSVVGDIILLEAGDLSQLIAALESAGEGGVGAHGERSRRNTRRPSVLLKTPMTFLWVTERICYSDLPGLWTRSCSCCCKQATDTEMGKHCRFRAEEGQTPQMRWDKLSHTLLPILVVVIFTACFRNRLY